YSRMNLTAAQLATQRAVMQAIWPYMIGLGAIFSAVLYGVLAAVQWRMMTRVIPLIMLAMIAYSLVANIGMRLLESFRGPELPLWIMLLVWPASLVSAVIYVASLQGAMLLHRLRREP
ncbi:MAG: hypothetical protein ACK4N1_20195, partial [Pseudorhizobium sp.]